jgi:hypothetical protein
MTACRPGCPGLFYFNPNLFMTKRERGRPAYVPDDATRKTVLLMARVGVTEADIAMSIEIAPKTLRKYYRAELDTSHIKANAAVGNTLYAHATGTARKATAQSTVSAATFWARTRMGWKEPAQTHEHMGKDGQPIEIGVNPLEIIESRLTRLADARRAPGSAEGSDDTAA